MADAVIKVYHAGFSRIESPDVGIGRRNADFGGGFYTSPDPGFASRWARVRAGSETYINEYEFDTEGLSVKRLSRGAEWFDIIYAYRNGLGDPLSDFDAAIGPVANDTLYDVWGVTTSGLISPGQALALLSVGPQYTQIAVKSTRAASRLRFISANVISRDDAASYREVVLREQDLFREAFLEQAEKLGLT